MEKMLFTNIFSSSRKIFQMSFLMVVETRHLVVNGGERVICLKRVQKMCEKGEYSMLVNSIFSFFHNVSKSRSYTGL